ncbi:MAG TPA: EamA family transporter [bacterium]|nr:EamA family transporter [bacterium]
MEKYLNPSSKPFQTVLLTAFTLTAFAANSVLCRLALGRETIDAAAFTVIRLLSAALVLGFLLAIRGRLKMTLHCGSWFSACMLFLYAASFSYAYMTLNTGTGALILFGAVQITILLVYRVSGNRMAAAEWLGALAAFLGFVFLVLPGVTAPSLKGFILMSAAGAAWGFYTLGGRASESPMTDTAANFIRTLPLVLMLFLLTNPLFITRRGVLLAIISGAVTSGLGYTLWYRALRGLSAAQAAVVQLMVPVIAALGGVFFNREIISGRLILSALMILGGICVTALARTGFEKRRAGQ